MNSYLDKHRKDIDAKRKAEIQMGRRRTTITMMEGVIEELCRDYGINKGTINLDTAHEDIRQWEVVVGLAEDVFHRESLWEFPSDELRTMLMLVKK